MNDILRNLIGKRVKVLSSFNNGIYTGEIGTIIDPTNIEINEECACPVRLARGQIITCFYPGRPTCCSCPEEIEIIDENPIPTLFIVGSVIKIEPNASGTAGRHIGKLAFITGIHRGTNVASVKISGEEYGTFSVVLPTSNSVGECILFQEPTVYNKPFELGDYVTVLEEDDFYYQVKQETCKIFKLNRKIDSYWYSLNKLNGEGFNAYQKIRYATVKELIDLDIIIPSMYTLENSKECKTEWFSLTKDNAFNGATVMFKHDCLENLLENGFNVSAMKESFPDWQKKTFTLEYDPDDRRATSIKIKEFHFSASRIKMKALLILVPKVEVIDISKILPKVKGFKAEVLDYLLNKPEQLPILKTTSINRKYYDKVINSLLPFKIGIEVECLESLTTQMIKAGKLKKDSHSRDLFEDFKKILHCSDYSDDYNSDGSEDICEQRMCFKGHKEIIALRRFTALLTKYCILDSKGGIHYHIDFPEFKNNKALCISAKPIVTKYLDKINTIFNYRGHFNHKEVRMNTKCSWVNLRTDTNTIEVRIASLKFDYKQIVSEIICLSEIIQDIRKELKLKHYKL